MARADVEVIAHRGASAYAPEHTLHAYDLALAQGADTLEVDVRPTADGGLVLVHDPTLLRTVGDPRPVGELDAAALGALAVHERPLALDDVLERYGRRTRLLIDLKDPVPAWEGGVVEAIDRHGLHERATVQSFDAGAMRRLAGAVPWLEVMPLFQAHSAWVADLDTVASYAGAIGPWHGAVDADLLATARTRGLEVRAWTVDARPDMERLLALGVDGLITNAPDVARAAAAPGPAPPAVHAA